MLFDNVETAKMHGLDTSNVSSRVESSQVEFGLMASMVTEKLGNPQNSFPDYTIIMWFRVGYGIRATKMNLLNADT